MAPGCRRLIYGLFLVVVIMAAVNAPAEAGTSIKEEIEIGARVAKEIEEQFPLTERKDWLEDIQRAGNKLVSHVNRKEIPYSFKIIQEKVNGKDELDAFSLPGGPVYFSEKMWQFLTPNERFGVLAHEIAHIDKRHAIDTMSEMNRRSLWAAAILIITGAKSGWWDAADLTNQLYTLKYSRKREREADMMGVDLLVAAGESPAGLVTAMKKLLVIEKDKDFKTLRILSTHPETEDRVKYLTERCLELGVKPEDLELKSRDDPDRLGSVVSLDKRNMIVTVNTTRPLGVNETVWIKKPMWSEDENATVPKPVAKGVSLEEGSSSKVAVNMEEGFEFGDIKEGDGVYPRELDPAPSHPDKEKPAKNASSYYLDES